MNSDEFNKLTIVQAQEGFKLCSDNAIAHFSSAEILAKENLFPIANSHLILATEEATKAIFLYLKLNANEFDFDIKQMFYKHSHKHQLANENFEIFYDVLLRLQSKIVALNRITFSEEYFSELHKSTPYEADTERVIVMAFEAQYNRLSKLNLEKSRPTITKWWNDADKNKMIGFYVDFKNKTWKSPKVITEEDYRLSHFLTNSLILLIKTIISTDAKIITPNK